MEDQVMQLKRRNITENDNKLRQEAIYVCKLVLIQVTE